MNTIDTKMNERIHKIFETTADRLRGAGEFAGVVVSEHGLYCQAQHVESEAFYRAEPGEQEGAVWIGLYTPDRWLSESIEADLMHVGDKLEELLEEELVDQGVEEKYDVEHFRDEQKQYVFRSSVALPEDHESAQDLVSRVLLAYEAAFRPLGDMDPGEE